ncbi:MAG TPA: TonB-dependent receptor, partial [Vicinamibacterales bacterium]|nr:TonB-dependent receptor [Vicinamibacterales bacterium]
MIRPSGLLFLVAAALVTAAPAGAQAVATPSVQQPASGNTVGTVVDISGAVIPAADVVVTSRDGRTSTVTTDPDGNFDAGVMAARVRVSSEGFESVTVEIDGTGPVQIVLRPVNFADSVIVTATRGAERLPSAASSTVLTSAELSNMAAGALDDALRSTPGFTLFRRSSSRVANPTTQGVTLRGVSGSGSSRTLVLADGVPLNDPFGSWVYWNRIPLAAVDRVEVVRGATGDLYGAGALGGVIQLLTVQPSRTRARATIDGGSHDTFRGSLFAAAEKNGWNASGAYEGVRTDGVFVLAPEVRGAVDTRADSDYSTGFATFGKRGNDWHVTARGALYEEDRGNGTVVQVNTTDWKQFSLEIGTFVGGGVFEVHGVGSSQDYYQTFSAVAAGRATERLTFEQFIDTSHRGVNAQWSRPINKLTMIVGADFRHTHAIQDEFRYALVSGVNTRSGPFLSGGTENVAAAYARANVAVTDTFTLEFGARADSWKSEPEDSSLPTKDVSYISPRAAMSMRAGRFQFQASGYYANRTPSLNELHRRFAVGNQITLANPELDPETLSGVEGGVLTQFARASIRATAFFNDLDGAIANVTLSQSPTAIVRQRQNSDTIRATGVEIELDSRFSNSLSASAQIVFTSSHFRGSVATPAIADNEVPQVPNVQGGVALTWFDPRWFTAATQIRFSGEQYDDDLNTEAFVLGAYAVWDATVSRGIVRGLTGFLAVENILDQEYDTARTPLRSIGWPRTLRVGARITWQ